jgi:hypothetical protein
LVSGVDCEGLRRTLLVVLVGEDREQDALDALPVGHDAHRPGAAPDLAEAPFDGVGRARRLTPGRVVEHEEGQQGFDVHPQATHRRGIASLPAIHEGPRLSARGATIACVADAVQAALDRRAIREPHLVEHVAHLQSRALAQ